MRFCASRVWYRAAARTARNWRCLVICCPLTSYDGSESDRVVVDTVGPATCCECDGVFFCNYERARFYRCQCDCGYCIDSEHHRCKSQEEVRCVEKHVFFTCVVCLEIRDHFECDGFFYGQLWEDLQTNLYPTLVAGGPCLVGLSPAAKDALFEDYLANLESTDREWAEHWGDARDSCATSEAFSAWFEEYGYFERSAPAGEVAP